MPHAWRGGLAMVVCRGRGHGLALRLRAQHLLADRRVLPALQALHGILPPAKAKLHGIGVVSGQLRRALQAAEGVHVEAKKRVAGGFSLPYSKWFQVHRKARPSGSAITA